MESNVIEMNRELREMESWSKKKEQREVVEDILGTLCLTFSHKMSPPLLVSWNIGLEGVPDQYVLEGLQWTLKNWEGSFMPKINEFVEICRDIRKKKRLAKEIEQKVDDQYDSGESLSREDAKKLFGMLNKLATSQHIKETLNSIGRTPGKVEPSKVQFYEYFDSLSHNFYYLCHGHIEPDFFKGECKKQYMSIPHTIKHLHRRPEVVKKKDEKGNVIGAYSSFTPCQEKDKGAKPVTVGYCR